ncbi:uncharacterized protein AFUA_4G11120 [Aspergillus fumigatus Af293]|uniref:Uncharacterized protein n=2 Tax=Aspergillus fumigatus TaxID=746128 RepID=Q4WQ05_ASPFU|nr:hypothetical protein AFUA_4G11120 [Aspergillus fumigatus Af293]EAL89679.1 hypothetical protein AFUA_4G11120 [Aspergillus fumigatus Af293]EDP50478.1 hypothetical protein AFUB_068150 [Aspergillus fumigatus A1163]
MGYMGVKQGYLQGLSLITAAKQSDPSNSLRQSSGLAFLDGSYIIGWAAIAN